MSDEDFYDSFEPVPPAKGEHFWRVKADGHRAECERCGLMVRAVLSQIQAGRAPSARMVLAGSGGPYTAAQHGRCMP